MQNNKNQTQNGLEKNIPKVSILILTYNAIRYVMRTLISLKQTNYSNYEVIIFDNNSEKSTKNYLVANKHLYDKLILSEQNLLWIKGNNEAFKYISADTDYVLLLNSDIEIRNSGWLNSLISVHKRGITACGWLHTTDNRPDGWCFLIDKDLYAKYKLDENKFKVFFSSGDLTAKIINEGLSCQTIKNSDNFIHHFGHASGVFENNANDQIQYELSVKFNNSCVLLETIPTNDKDVIKLSRFFYLYDRIRRFMIRPIMVLNKYIMRKIS